MKPTSPTAKQQAVLDFLRTYITENGHAPTYAEIAAKFGWSTTMAWRYIAVLQKKGCITREKSKHNSIQIIGNGAPATERIEQALRVISTWAAFDAEAGERRALMPQDVIEICERALS